MERYILGLDLIDAIVDGDLSEAMENRWQQVQARCQLLVPETTVAGMHLLRRHNPPKLTRWLNLLGQLGRLPAPAVAEIYDEDPLLHGERAAAHCLDLPILCWQPPSDDSLGLYRPLSQVQVQATESVPFLDLRARFFAAPDLLTRALLATAASGWYVLGEAVRRFEMAWADYLDVPWAVGVSNGLDGLHIALRVLGVGKGDEVIVPSNTYIATWLAVTFTGARPLPVEPNPRTMVLEAAGIEAAIGKRTKAVIPVHLYGHPCNMPEIMRVARTHGLYVVEDNAQAQGAAWRGQKTGSFGHLNATSLYPGKNLGAMGDAGILSGTDERFNQQARRLRNYGSSRKYYNEEYGFNARLDELQAAVLLPLLQLLDAQNERRREIAGRYTAALAGVGDLELPVTAAGATHVWHQYVVRSQRRDDLMYFLQQQGVGTLLHYPVPPHLQQTYRWLGFKAGDFPVAEDIARRCLSLPIDPTLSDRAIDRVVELIHDFFA